MISEEKIRAYVKMNIALAKLQVLKTGVKFSEEDLSNGIANAVKWSISEFKRELWHDASEEPKSNKQLLILWETSTHCRFLDVFRIPIEEKYGTWENCVKTKGITKLRMVINGSIQKISCQRKEVSLSRVFINN